MTKDKSYFHKDLNSTRLNYKKSHDEKNYLAEIKVITGNAINDSELLEYGKLDEIEFSKKALDAVATIAIEQKLGARGLRKILDRALIDIQYELPDLSERGVTKIVITDQTIKDDMPPLLVKG